MSAFFDDLRNAPEGRVVVREPNELKRLLQAGVIDDLSMDHDLGDYGRRDFDRDITGYDLICWMEETNSFPRGRILVHSQNLVGRQKMLAAINSWH